MKGSVLMLRVFIFSLVLLPVSSVVLVWASRERIVAVRSGGLPVLGSVGEFSLTNAAGQPVGLSDLRGRVWVASFILTRCSGACPIIVHNKKQLLALLPEDRADVRLVSFSVDPEYDTPSVLTTYAGKNGASVPGWWFLTGSKAQVRELMRDSFKLVADESLGTPEEPVLHSSKLVLVDRVGQIRGYYDGLDVATMKQVARDARRLMAARS